MVKNVEIYRDLFCFIRYSAGNYCILRLSMAEKSTGLGLMILPRSCKGVQYTSISHSIAMRR
jgi:hypothetical protein